MPTEITIFATHVNRTQCLIKNILQNAFNKLKLQI